MKKENVMNENKKGENGLISPPQLLVVLCC